MTTAQKALTAVVLIAALLAALYWLRGRGDEDRPPIIVENSGSIGLSFESNNDNQKEWKQEQSSDRYEQRHSAGKTVLSFIATDGVCSVMGADKITVSYGPTVPGTFTLERHQQGNKYHVDAVFPSGSTVNVDNAASAKKMRFVIPDTLVSFSGDTGQPCAPRNGKFTVELVQPQN
jgi:hypothetical protein